MLTHLGCPPMKMSGWVALLYSRQGDCRDTATIPGEECNTAVISDQDIAVLAKCTHVKYVKVAVLNLKSLF